MEKKYVTIPGLSKILKCSSNSIRTTIKNNKINSSCVVKLPQKKRDTIRINLEKMVENYPETFEMVEEFNINQDNHESRFITISEFSKKIGVTHITGWRYVVTNKIPHVNLKRILGKKIFIDVKELLAQNPNMKGHFANG